MSQSIITVPPCPAWCTTEHSPRDWEEWGHATYARMHATEHVHVDGAPVEVRVRQLVEFATDGTVEQTEPASIALLGDSELTSGQSRQLAAALVRAADRLDQISLGGAR
jgi:hypothetical protein